MLSPSLPLILDEGLLTSVCRQVQVLPRARDHKPDDRACAGSVFCKRACAISVVFVLPVLCVRKWHRNLCQPLPDGLWEEGRLGKQKEYLSHGEKVIEGENRLLEERTWL